MKPHRTALPVLIAAALLLNACTTLELLSSAASVELPDIGPEAPPAKAVTLTATGQWKPETQQNSELTPNQQKQLSIQAAKRNALGHLATQMQDVRLPKGSTIGALARQDDNARAYVDGLVRGARITDARPLSNRGYRVRVEAVLSPEDQACLVRGNCPPPPVCPGGPLRKVLVTAFPLRYPEQIHAGEYMGWPQATAEELAHLIDRGGKLLGAAAPERFPFESTEAAPEVERRQGVPLLTEWAGREHAQYVVAGMFRDFGMAKKKLVIPTRQLVVEAFIYDGISGELLARREFAKQLAFSWQMPKTVAPGTREFNTSRLGKLYYELLGDLGHWAESTVSCLPFSARVIKADGRRLHFDVGSDSGIEPGTELLLMRTATAPVSTPSGEVLMGGRVPLTGVVVTDVQPRYSVAEISAQKSPTQAHPGDVLQGL